MLKVNLGRASFGLALSFAVCAAGVAFAQDGANAPSQKAKALSVRSIRPFVRSETPANQSPNLYDKKSNEFDYFREDLGRKEISSKQRARLEQLASRVVYSDPMDKPAADGTPFVNIYSPDEIFADGAPYEGMDDPDVLYADSENNVLARLSDLFRKGSSFLSTFNQGGAGMDRNGASSDPYGGGMAVGSSGTPLTPSVTMDPSVAPGGVSGGGPGGVSGGGPGRDMKDGPAAAPKNVEPSKADDSKLLFEDDVKAENPFKNEVTRGENDFDLFKEAREFEPKAAAPASSSDLKYHEGP